MAYQTTDSFAVVSFHLYVIVKDWYVISTASFLSKGDWVEEKMMGVTM